MKLAVQALPSLLETSAKLPLDERAYLQAEPFPSMFVNSKPMRLTCCKSLLDFCGDREGLVGASLQHALQLGDQHDGLQCSHLSGHQLTHTQLVTHHALVRLQGSLQLHSRSMHIECEQRCKAQGVDDAWQVDIVTQSCRLCQSMCSLQQ